MHSRELLQDDHDVRILDSFGTDARSNVEHLQVDCHVGSAGTHRPRRYQKCFTAARMLLALEEKRPAGIRSVRHGRHVWGPHRRCVVSAMFKNENLA